MATPRRGLQNAPRRRRQPGTGGIYWSEADQLWRGAIEAGWTDKGTRRRVVVSCATPGPAGRAECARKLERKRAVLQSDKSAVLAPATVKTWAATWLEIQVRTQRPKSFATDRSAVTKWIVPTIGRKRLDALLKDAILEGHQVSNRLLLMTPPPPSVHDRDAINTEDARALLAVAAYHRDGSRWPAKLLQGMRQGEILGLTWPMVDFDYQLMDISWQIQALNYQHGCQRNGNRWECGRRFGEDCPRAPCEFRMAISTAGSTARYAWCVPRRRRVSGSCPWRRGWPVLFRAGGKPHPPRHTNSCGHVRTDGR